MRRRLIENISLPIKPISESVAADICIVDNNTLDKLIIEPDAIESINPECYTPIGVVVVPASHTDDGTARIISLASMDYDNPDKGNTTNDKWIYFGGYYYNDNIPNLSYTSYVPFISDNIITFSSYQTLLGFIPSSYNSVLSSDYFDAYQNPFDVITYYGEEDNKSTEKYAIPSPYLNDGSKNEIYHSTENTSNVLSDMNGKSNTEKILAVDNSNSTNWQTAATIQNELSNQYIHPAAQCCWRYHTIGTNQGDWYLPSAGELGYLAVRWKAINNSIKKISYLKLFQVLQLPSGRISFSSSSILSDIKIITFLITMASGDFDNCCSLNENEINSGNLTRAFLKV